MKLGKLGLTHMVDATRYSMQGIAAAFRNEVAFRQELLLVAVLAATSFWLAANTIEWVILVAPLFILLIVELLNTALENTIDRMGEEFHVLAGRAKDMGSAAVLLSLLLIAACWGAVLWSRIHV